MLFNQSDLDEQIRRVHVQLEEKRKEFDAALKNDQGFDEIKRLYYEIRELSQRQELLFEETKMQKGF